VSQRAIDETSLTLTLPAYAWAALRGAARRGVRYHRHRAIRPQSASVDGINLEADRADTLDYAANQINDLLRQVNLGGAVVRRGT